MRNQKGFASLMVPVALASFAALMTQFNSSVNRTIHVKKIDLQKLNHRAAEKYRDAIEAEIESDCRHYLEGENLSGPISTDKLDELVALYPVPRGLRLDSIEFRTMKLGNAETDAKFGYLRAEIRLVQTNLTQNAMKEGVLLRKDVNILVLPNTSTGKISDCAPHGSPHAAAAYANAECLTKASAIPSFKDCAADDDAYRALVVSVCSKLGTVDLAGCATICPSDLEMGEECKGWASKVLPGGEDAVNQYLADHAAL